jgi:SAM-dependent MidA family methyltransferase
MIEYLKEKIGKREDKHISFYEYMNDCLYHPEFGYYMNQKQKIGKQGDFYTSSSVHSVFAETIVDVVVNIFQEADRSIEFCEMGAGTGLFAKQFLDYLKDRYPVDYAKVLYTLIEKSPYHQNEQKDLLKEHIAHIKWANEIGEVESFSGVFFSNELVDAFPVHLVEKQNGDIKEVGVGWSEAGLIEVYKPLHDQEIMDYLKQNSFELKEGQRMEVPLDAVKWAKRIGQWVVEGIWLTIDYGYTNEELMYPQHRGGSLLCYDQHQVDANPLLKPGMKDMTYHVHFDVLTETTREKGWSKLGYYNQSDFLFRAGIVEKLQENIGGDPFRNEGIRLNRAIRELISPEGISRSFHVLALAKGSFIKNTYRFLEPFSFQKAVAKQKMDDRDE